MYQFQNDYKKLTIPLVFLFGQTKKLIIIPLPASDQRNIDNDGNPIVTVNLDVLLTLKYNSKDPMNPFHLAHNSALCFNLCCSIKNELGRPCWRDGGMCYVHIIELFGNSLLGSDEHTRGNEIDTTSYWTMRKIYNSAYNVMNSNVSVGNN